MNIAIATSNRRVNGAVVYARRIVPLLAARGHRVWLAASPDSWIAERTAGEAALLPTDFRRWPPGEVGRIAAFCRRERIDLFHSHSTRSSHFGALLQFVHGIPSVAHLHSSIFQSHAWFHELVIAVSRHTLDRHRRRFVGLGRRGVVLPNFVDGEDFRRTNPEDRLRPLLGVPPGTPVLMVVGRVCRTKGQDLAVKSLSIVRRSHPSAVLALVGAGRPRPWHFGDGVFILGHRDDLPDLMPHATLLVVPSRRESFSLAAAEAMACGVPVVATAAGGVAELVGAASGKLVRRNDPSALAAAIVSLLDDPAGRVRQAEEGMRAVRTHHAPGPHVDSLERLYASVAASAGKPVLSKRGDRS